MSAPENSVATWQALANEGPDKVLERLNAFSGSLSENDQRAVIASQPGATDLRAQIESALSAEEPGPLAGTPYVLQDLFDVAGLPTHCGALFDDLFDSPLDENSALSQKLTDLGAVLATKTVPSQFGLNLQGSNQVFGDCPHPIHPELIAGGGAGTAAYWVKKGGAPLGFGLDSSAGIRVPAAFQGLFGFRMARNEYARGGVLPIAPSVDAVGFVCNRPDDLLRTIQAFHPDTDGDIDRSPRGYRLEDPKIRLDSQLRAGFMSMARHLDIDERPGLNKKLVGAFDQAATAFATIKNRQLFTVHKYWAEEYREQYEEALLDQIEDGQLCTAARAERAAAVELDVRLAFARFFEQYDYLILPVTPTPTPTRRNWNLQMEQDLRQLNALTSLSALPALILPFDCGSGRSSAAQLILNPRKLHLCAPILDQVSRFYAS